MKGPSLGKFQHGVSDNLGGYTVESVRCQFEIV